MLFGEWLAIRMDELGFTQDALGDEVGVTQQAVSKWLKNETGPSPVALRLAIALRTSPEDLIQALESPPTAQAVEEQRLRAEEMAAAAAEGRPAKVARSRRRAQ